MLGLPPGDDQMVREKAVMMVQSDPRVARKVRHIAAYNWMTDYAAKVIAERQKHPGEDLIWQFGLAEIDGEKLAEREVLLTTTTLIMAGIESLGGFTVMFALNMADFPEARRELVADPALIPDAIEESLRYNTSGQRFRRYIMKDTPLHGQVMREGDFVCLAYGSGNRDERHRIRMSTTSGANHAVIWASAVACMPVCAMVARLSVKIIFEEFLKEFPEFTRLQQQLPWMPSSTFRSPMKLDLAVS
jgi:cytochrome P450